MLVIGKLHKSRTGDIASMSGVRYSLEGMLRLLIEEKASTSHGTNPRATIATGSIRGLETCGGDESSGEYGVDLHTGCEGKLDRNYIWVR